MTRLKWILAYLFDCVHPRTTWPRADEAGFAYVCCLDCGRELPYSLERMRIVNREELVAISNLPGAQERGTSVRVCSAPTGDRDWKPVC